MLSHFDFYIHFPISSNDFENLSYTYCSFVYFSWRNVCSILFPFFSSLSETRFHYAVQIGLELIL